MSSSPDEKNIEFYIKNLGDWTSELYGIVGSPGKPINLVAYLDGPYGSSSISIDSEKY
jgi:predicted ferric reductase